MKKKRPPMKEEDIKGARHKLSAKQPLKSKTYEVMRQCGKSFKANPLLSDTLILCLRSPLIFPSDKLTEHSFCVKSTHDVPVPHKPVVCVCTRRDLKRCH